MKDYSQASAFPFFVLLREYYGRRRLLWELIVRDFRSKFVGSAFGLLWAVIQPAAMMLILFFVFKYGLKAQGQGGVGFAAWFFSAMVAWNFFQDGIASTTTVFQDYSYLVKKMNFRLPLLPLVKVISSLIMHAIFMAVVVLLISFVHQFPGVYLWQWLYYSFAASCLIFSLGWVLALFDAFFKDVQQVVAILLQLGFWATPILWTKDVLPEKLEPLLFLNPVFYLTEGFRNTLVHGKWVSELPWTWTIYFWGVTLLLFGLSLYSYRRMRPHLGDVL